MKKKPAILTHLQRDGIAGPYENLERKIRLRHRFTVLGIWAIVTALLLFLFAWLLPAQLPPLPDQPEPLKVKVTWEHLEGWQFYRASDTNGEPAFIQYRVYYATNVNGPWEVRALTTNNVALITNVHRVTGYFYVTSSNLFLESDRSDLLSLPLNPVKLPTFTLPAP